MKFVLNPSLEHIALVKIGATLWNKADIKALLLKYFTLPGNKREKWQEIVENISTRALQLPLPAFLTKKVLAFIRPIGLQMFLWLLCHKDRYFGLDLPDEFFWTSQGTIDQKRTAEIFIKDESVDISIRYKLACIYCFEDKIQELWEKISEDQKRFFYDEDFTKDFRQQDLVKFWTYYTNKDVVEIETFINKKFANSFTTWQFAFMCAADNGNRAATEHFFRKLDPEDRKGFLSWAAVFVTRRFYDARFVNVLFPTEYYIEVLCFLLSQMDEEQQIGALSIYHYEILRHFLYYPWQSFFIETASHLWKIIDAIDYYCLLEVIISKVISGYKDWNYQKLFNELWRQSPKSHKVYCIERCGNGEILPHLFKIGDLENIKLILKDASVADKEEIIFGYHGKNICKNLAFENNFDLLIFFIKECISSKSVMVRFKKEFNEYIKLCRAEELQRDEWKRFFQLLDDLIL